MAKRNHHGAFWRYVHRAYGYRTWWLDIPSLFLLGLVHWEFYSFAEHPVPRELIIFFRVALGAYWAMKEGVRWKMHGILSRRGNIFVAVWIAVFLEFSVVVQYLPKTYVMPPSMLFNTCYVFLGFMGLWGVKQIFARKYPQAFRELEKYEDNGL